MAGLYPSAAGRFQAARCAFSKARFIPPHRLEAARLDRGSLELENALREA